MRLWSCAAGKTTKRSPSEIGVHAGFRARDALFEHDELARVAEERPREHALRGFERLVVRLGDDDALAGAESVGLHDGRRRKTSARRARRRGRRARRRGAPSAGRDARRTIS